MKDISYFQMRAFLYPRETQLSAPFKLHELEEIWFCTLKNVKRKLKKFEDDGRLEYLPGKGRGHLSRVIFKQPFQEEVRKTLDEYVKDDQLDSIIQLMQLPIPKSWFTHFVGDVQTLFGLQKENGSKDTLRTIMSRNITTLDPLFASIAFESFLIQQLGDTLVRYDETADSIVPHLAHHWTVNENHTVWTFYLRKGVRFHHQSVLTSEDVIHSFQRFIKYSTPNFWLVQEILSIEKLSEFTVRITLKKPNPFFLRYVGSANLSILPKDIPFDEHQWIGTGPFLLKKRSEKQLILEAFDYYFLERPFLDEIEFWRVSQETMQVMTYQVGKEIECDHPIQKQEVENGFRFLSFNFRKPSIVHQHSFRKAVYHLLDIKEMWKELRRGKLVEASSFFPQKSSPVLKSRSLVKPLLEKAGYNGETLTLFSFSHPKAMEEAEWLVNRAKKEGLRLRIENLEMKDFYTSKLENEADLAFMGEVSSTDAHLSFLAAFYNNALLFRRFLKEDDLCLIEGWLDQMKQETTYEGREAWIDKVEDYIRNEHLFIFTHHPIKYRTFHPMIQDIQFQSYGYVDLRKLWIQ
ncbi:SgrR family transcriptional regulator [Fictibacillus gelatini]|uniref:SgrR family transcriptional regulator n=1 Tax=Fictibacillus gelatini TaxID=225985 RepID=UPI000400B77B|nr:SgrR family transcriptional regulator [Fictibacillus gelatini]